MVVSWIRGFSSFEDYRYFVPVDLRNSGYDFGGEKIVRAIPAPRITTCLPRGRIV